MSIIVKVALLLYQEYAYIYLSDLPNFNPKLKQSASVTVPAEGLRVVSLAHKGVTENDSGSNFIRYCPVQEEDVFFYEST